MNDIKAVLFDLDGTLLDSMYVWQYVDEEFLRRRGITPPDDYGRQCSHRSFYETALYTIDLFNLPENATAYAGMDRSRHRRIPPQRKTKTLRS